jgi:hypothetical protein
MSEDFLKSLVSAEQLPDLTAMTLSSPGLTAARAAVERAGEDSEWVQRPGALQEAEQLGRYYLSFPELNLHWPAERLALRIAARTSQGPGTHAAANGAVLALAICPESEAVLELSLRLLSGLLPAESFQKLMSLWLDGSLFSAGRAAFLDYVAEDLDRNDLPELIGLVADQLVSLPTMSAMRLGGILQQRFVREDSATYDLTKRRRIELGIGRAVIRCRKIVTAWKTTAHKTHSGRDGSALLTLLASASHRVTAAKLTTGGVGAPANAVYGAGDLHWGEFKLQLGSALFLPSDLKTEYAKIDLSTGISTAAIHTGGRFCFGPCINVAPGFYKIDFLGKADSRLRVTYSVIGYQGSSCVTLAVSMGVRRLTGEASEPLISFDIKCHKAVNRLEFIIHVEPSLGEVMLEGVLMRRSGV